MGGDVRQPRSHAGTLAQPATTNGEVRCSLRTVPRGAENHLVALNQLILNTDYVMVNRYLGTAVAGAYYLHPDVRARLGYPGQVPRPINALEFPAFEAEGLLDHLVTR